jgi:hypothetical protein
LNITSKSVFIFLLLLSNISFSQNEKFNDYNYKKFITTVGSDSVITLPDKFLIFGSVFLYSDSSEVSPEFYSVDYRYGKIILHKKFIDDIIQSGNPKRLNLIAVYKNFPFSFEDNYSKFEIISKLDTIAGDTVKLAEIKSDFPLDNLFGSDLQKSGSIFRGFTVGNNRDLSLQSGFRLQLNGKLSSDIDITAALTDENTPIQPEGNTQKLQELDKVFVELRSANFIATLGDIDVNFSGSSFFNFNKKLQGAKGFADFKNHSFFLSGALSRGRFSSNTFSGIDGVQGPYRLIGADNEVNIIVLAGSEKVYLDGVLMTRGESNDYTIDYSNGQIKFTNKRIITNASRIVVDFEYSDKKYSRSFIAGQLNNKFFKNNFDLSISYIRERDDPNKPIDFNLSDSDKTIIADAGDNKFKASKSGAVFVGRDSLGFSLGLYIQRDTLINSQLYTKYIYAPGDTNALYQVTFSYVGQGKGDYNSLSSSAYVFAGIGSGSYLPLIFFPLPVAYQSVNLNSKLTITKNFSFSFEGSLSDFDANLLSNYNDTDNKGGAVIASLNFTPSYLKLSKSKYAEISFFIKQKIVNKLYNAVDRLNKIEYNRIWDIQDSLKLTESSNELGLNFKSDGLFNINLNGGSLKRGQNFNAYRAAADLKLIGDSLNIPSVYYTADFIQSKDYLLDYSGKWFRQSANLNYKINPNNKNKIGIYNLIFELNSEDKQTRSINFDTATAGSFKFYEFKPGINISDLLNFDLTYMFNYRIDDAFLNGEVSNQSNSFTHSIGFKFKNFDFLSAYGDIIIYNKYYKPEFQSKGFADSRTILVTSQSNIWFLNRGLNANLFYKVSSEKTAKQEVIFIKVPLGTGNYKYIGDLNGNGLQDENEFVLTNFDGDYIKIFRPTDQLFPTTDLQSSVSFNFVPSRFISASKKGFLFYILNNITADTYASVQEKSKDSVLRNIYLLKFSTFQNDINTLNGINTVQQDIGLFETHQYFGIKLRFIQRKGFLQLFSGNERSLNTERSIRLRLSFTDDLALITDYFSAIERNQAPGVVIRNWNINSKSIVSELIYKPAISIETGFKVQLKRASDFYPPVPTRADINIQSFKLAYVISSKGTLRAEISRNEALIYDNAQFIPYDLTKGLSAGKSYFWSLNFEYRISNFIQAAVNYFGRAEQKSKVIHTGTAEIRAYF